MARYTSGTHSTQLLASPSGPGMLQVRSRLAHPHPGSQAQRSWQVGLVVGVAGIVGVTELLHWTVHIGRSVPKQSKQPQAIGGRHYAGTRAHRGSKAPNTGSRFPTTHGRRAQRASEDKRHVDGAPSSPKHQTDSSMAVYWLAPVSRGQNWPWNGPRNKTDAKTHRVGRACFYK